MYFAQDAGLETFDPDRLAEQDQTPLTCLRDGDAWFASLRAAPPQPVPPRRPPHESRGVQAGTSWRRSSESGMHLLPCTDDGSVATASALQLLCEVDEVPQPAPSAIATAAAPAAASRSVGTGVAPAPVRHVVDGSELLLLLERCDASRGERSMSLKGSKEKYADAAAALEDAARAALGDSADRMRLVLNPPLAALPAALRVRYKAPRRVGHQKRNYPRLGSFEYGYVLLHHGGASRDKAPLLTAAHAAAHRIRGQPPACPGLPAGPERSAFACVDAEERLRLRSRACPKSPTARAFDHAGEFIGHGHLASKLATGCFPSAARGALALARCVQDDLHYHHYRQGLAAEAAVLRMQREKAEAAEATAAARHKTSELALLGEAVGEAERRAREAQEAGAPNAQAERELAALRRLLQRREVEVERALEEAHAEAAEAVQAEEENEQLEAEAAREEATRRISAAEIARDKAAEEHAAAQALAAQGSSRAGRAFEAAHVRREEAESAERTAKHAVQRAVKERLEAKEVTLRRENSEASLAAFRAQRATRSAAGLHQAWRDAAAALRVAERDLRPIEEVAPLKATAASHELDAARAAEEAEEAEAEAQGQARDVGVAHAQLQGEQSRCTIAGCRVELLEADVKFTKAAELLGRATAEQLRLSGAAADAVALGTRGVGAPSAARAAARVAETEEAWAAAAKLEVGQMAAVAAAEVLAREELAEAGMHVSQAAEELRRGSRERETQHEASVKQAGSAAEAADAAAAEAAADAAAGKGSRGQAAAEWARCKQAATRAHALHSELAAERVGLLLATRVADLEARALEAALLSAQSDEELLRVRVEAAAAEATLARDEGIGVAIALAAEIAAAETAKASGGQAGQGASGAGGDGSGMVVAVDAGEVFGADLESETVPARRRTRTRMWAVRASQLTQRASHSAAELRAAVVQRTEAAHVARRRDYGRAVTVVDEAAALRRSARELRRTGGGGGGGAANVAGDVAARCEVLHAEALSAVGTMWERLVLASDAWQQAAIDFGGRTAGDADKLAAAARRELLLAVSTAATATAQRGGAEAALDAALEALTTPPAPPPPLPRLDPTGAGRVVRVRLAPPATRGGNVMRLAAGWDAEQRPALAAALRLALLEQDKGRNGGLGPVWRAANTYLAKAAAATEATAPKAASKPKPTSNKAKAAAAAAKAEAEVAAAAEVEAEVEAVEVAAAEVSPWPRSSGWAAWAWVPSEMAISLPLEECGPAGQQAAPTVPPRGATARATRGRGERLRLAMATRAAADRARQARGWATERQREGRRLAEAAAAARAEQLRQQVQVWATKTRMRELRMAMEQRQKSERKSSGGGWGKLRSMRSMGSLDLLRAAVEALGPPTRVAAEKKGGEEGGQGEAEAS